MALTTINSDGVKDDSIVNADIKSDAAIAGTKVAPDFGSQNLVTTGNVGVGISPTKKLTVFGTGAGEATVQIEGEGGADPYINFLANNAQHWSLGVDDSDSDKFKLSEHSALGTNDYLVVDTSGNVGINTVSPDTLLHLEATNTSSAVNNSIRISDADTAVVANQVCGRIEFETADTGNPGVNCQIDAIYSGSGGGGELQIRTGFAGSLVDAVKIDDTGDVILGDGNLSFASGHGIDFSASSNESGVFTGGEVLNDYEVGSYTPNLLAHDGSSWNTVSLSTGSKYGSYVKIGNMVHVQIYITAFHVDSAHDGDLVGITLPITADSGFTGNSVLTTVHSNCFVSGKQTNFFVINGSSNAYGIQEGSTNYDTWKGDATRYLAIAGTYRAA